MKKLIIKLVSIWAKRVTRRSDKLFQRHNAAQKATRTLEQKLLQANDWDRVVYAKAYTTARTSSARAHRRWSAAWDRKQAWQARERALRILWGIEK